MIQLIVNTNLLRELDERKLIYSYARYTYSNEHDTTDDDIIKENLKKILDWDENGSEGLGIYCGKFENIKKKDWSTLIGIIKLYKEEIEKIANDNISNRIRLESIKKIDDFIEEKERHKKERFTDENYKVSGRGKKAKTCIYNGKEYKSRQECVYKEGITQNQLYRYLEKTGQV